jgi:hypothetical protein
MKFTDLSIDLETLGTDPGCVITQVGLCAFDARGHKTTHYSMLWRIDPQSCLDHGMHVSWSTISWWLRQDQAARDGMGRAGGYGSLVQALTSVNAWIESHTEPGKFEVWGHGSGFDVTLLEAAYRIAKVPVPWEFRKVRDLRTLIQLKPSLTVERPLSKVEHDAMHDAIAQAEWIRACTLAIEK